MKNSYRWVQTITHERLQKELQVEHQEQENTPHKPRHQVKGLRTNVHAQRTKGSQLVSKAHIHELPPCCITSVLPETTDGKVVSTMTRLLK